MRDIKFRAWDSDDNEMIDFDEDNYSGEGYEKLGQFFSDMFGCEMMQYTGLKDKNGVDVYEGDLLRTPPESKYQEENYSAFEVFFHDNDCSPTDVGLCLGRMKNYGAIAGGYSGFKLIPKHINRMIVCGNIHENPELLEAK